MIIEQRKNVLLSLGLSIVLILNALLFIPFTIYSGNIDSFTTPIWSILFLYIVPGMFIILIIFIMNGFVKLEKKIKINTVSCCR